MPINDFSSYIKTCLEEKDYDLYERIAKDESANAFFEQLEEVYFEETLKYREEL